MRLLWGLVWVLLLTGCFAKTDDIPKEDPELNVGDSRQFKRQSCLGVYW